MNTLIATLNGHKDKVWHVCWNYQGTSLASCSSDKSIRIWQKEGESWACKTIINDAHSRTIRSVCWSPCGKYLASASFDATVNIWENVKGEFECIATLEGHENEVKSVCWFTSGSLLATCSRDKSVWVWEVGEDQEYECLSVIPSHTQDVKKVIFHPSKEMLASASYDNTIKLYEADEDDWGVVHTLEGHSSTVWSISFNHDGKRLASCSDDESIRIWQECHFNNKENSDNSTSKGLTTWKCICSLTGYHTRPVYDISWCKLTSAIATACGDDYIRIFKESENISDANNLTDPSYELILSLPFAHSEDVNSVSWSPSCKGLLASAGDDGIIKLWDFSALLGY